MAAGLTISIHFKELETDEEVRDHLQARCEELATEFPEATHFELMIGPDVNSVQCHAHVTGKRTQIAAHASGAELPRQAGDAVLDKIERELRKDHDKRIFAPRRKVQKERSKRFS